MKSKLTLLLFVSLYSGLSLLAQKPRVNLFDNFTKGVVYLKNLTKTSSEFNYDASNQVLLYMQNTDIMELIDNTQIDSILIGFRKFVQYKKHFLEEVTLTNGSFFIDWLLNEKYIGKIGAMGLVTNAQVHVINTGYLYARMPEETFDVNTYSVENQNEYSFYWKNRFITFKNKKKLLKLVPVSYKERIRIFLNEKKLQLRTVDEVSQLMNYLYTLQ